MPNTTSFELSQKLDEVAKSKGYELPKSIMMWVLMTPNTKHAVLFDQDYLKIMQAKPYWTCPRYTTDELLAALGCCFNKPIYLHTVASKQGYDRIIEYAAYIDFDGMINPKLADTPSNALCKLFIYLIENDLMPNNA